MEERIYLSAPHMGGEEINFIHKAFDENWIAPLGPNVNGMETDLAEYAKVPYAAALSSGTAAIHLALILLNVQKDDIVLASSFTFSATINPIAYQGALPVLIDSEEETWNMDPELLEQAIKDYSAKGKKPKAVIFVHLYGMPGKIEEVSNICKQYDIPLIEDAAEALGASWNNKRAGSFGDFGIFSFNGNKIITTSGGGALLSQNKTWIDKARYLATQARDPAPYYQHSEIGYNYRMSNISAGIGRGQMQVLDKWIALRRENFNFYQENLGSLGFAFQNERPGAFANRWLTCVLFDENHQIGPEELRQNLETFNIETRPLWKPMHIQPVFKDCDFYVNGVSEKLFGKGLCLPSGSSLSMGQKQLIVEKIKQLVQ
ncbi:aminotransferase class I/II-fold pyridoxal phosphate-dependent enzyme [Marivirga sp. S37H4]|uniref:Aminotransferase class I/II-fold pyridoxal phosphate-dependent enzyme n=1 Tax=Marivirga aurantiaca TaxID=2802615 RepID=A0A934WVK6_9BACT|nr:aminotransferase class I/II-fold pyridoxal phosphate-dependent enzyme [Marivirga aurantiaca]MBK6263731.1 aminotransferase class I/II-fold pyridoxal phosphate-dependent enzyme [Marivirga aurantiaca]